ncbi:hypothetical protein [Candidatus Nitrosocaldus cavascurensis]|uniref:Uncharacterized protein n=2 Tax=Candidatus Nitrosocaldus TaxID=498374 RepID=A0A2K5AQ66_9ARCH|nr:hypothetical protein [Candidatus Nitrosocaldus cavascurensis]SPC33782.1 protein of unknown function [Candidatus Nitrosocaldus cavascurensis]
MSNMVSNMNDASTSILRFIEDLIKESVGNVIIWDEKSRHMKGKYFYVNVSKDMQVGILLGFIMDDNGRAKKCLALCFTDPKGRVDKSIAIRTENLFNSIIKKLEGFTIVKDDLSALMRTSTINDESKALEFFKSSLLLLVNALTSK